MLVSGLDKSFVKNRLLMESSCLCNSKARNVYSCYTFAHSRKHKPLRNQEAFPSRILTLTDLPSTQSLAFSFSIPGINISLISPAASFKKKLIRSHPRCLLTILN